VEEEINILLRVNLVLGEYDKKMKKISFFEPERSYDFYNFQLMCSFAG